MAHVEGSGTAETAVPKSTLFKIKVFVLRRHQDGRERSKVRDTKEIIRLIIEGTIQLIDVTGAATRNRVPIDEEGNIETVKRSKIQGEGSHWCSKGDQNTYRSEIQLLHRKNGRVSGLTVGKRRADVEETTSVGEGGVSRKRYAAIGHRSDINAVEW